MPQSNNVSIDDISARHRLGQKPKTSEILRALKTDLPKRWRIDQNGHVPKLIYEQLTETPLSYRIEVMCAPVKKDAEDIGAWEFGFRAELYFMLGEGAEVKERTSCVNGSLRFDEALDPIRGMLRELGERLGSTADQF